VARGINDAGQVVGICSFGTYATGFLYDRGVVTMLSFPGAHSTQAAGINNRGQIVGSYSDADSDHGFIFEAGKFKTVDDPDSSGGGEFLRSSTMILGINDLGEIVGTWRDFSTGQDRGFVAVPSVFKEHN